MPKPRRKHPGFNSLMGSGPGRAFYAIMDGLLGAPLKAVALERTREEQHVFRLDGSEHGGLFIETKERAEEDYWVREHGFLFQPEAARVWFATCTTYRWDPWLAAKLSGDRSLIEGPITRRYKVQAEKDEDLGKWRDRIELLFVPVNEAPSHLCGVSLNYLGDTQARYFENLIKPEQVMTLHLQPDQTLEDVMH